MVDFFLLGSLSILSYLLFGEPYFERQSMAEFYQAYAHQHDARITLFRRAFFRTVTTGCCVLLFVSLMEGKIHFADLGFRSISMNHWIVWPLWVKWFIFAFLTWHFFYFFIFATIIVRYKSYFRGYIIRKLAPVESIMPRSHTEYYWWVANSGAAMLEEVVYRGFIFYILPVFFPGISIVAVVIISVGLEVIHYFPRFAAMKYVGTSGLAFSLCYVLTQSIWIAMFYHFIYDIRTLFLPFSWVRSHHTPIIEGAKE
jgi:membrane protease YdiL (CAAX protease family)